MSKDLNGSELRVKKIDLPNYISPFILKVNNYKNLQQLKKKKKIRTPAPRFFNFQPFIFDANSIGLLYDDLT